MLWIKTIFLVVSLIGIFNTNVSADSMQEICQEILDDLKTAKGIPLDEAPTIKVDYELPNSTFSIAMFSPSTGQITIQRDAVQVCFDSLGIDATNGLAHIIAHELGHYIKGHKVRNRFIKKFQTQDLALSAIADSTIKIDGISQSKLDLLLDIYKKQSSKYLVMKNEAEADLEAGFLCYLAGYYSKVSGARAWEANYNMLGKKLSGDNYPSLKERMRLSHEVGERLESLIRIFELGNYSMITEDLKVASLCFTHVLTEFQSKELYNNLGVLELRKALEGKQDLYSIQEIIKYIYPIKMEISIDAQNELNLYPLGEIGGFDLYMDVFLPMLQDAINYFDKALNLDNHYAHAMHNKSITHALLARCKQQYDSKLESGNYFGSHYDHLLEEFGSLSIIEELKIAEAFAIKAKQIISSTTQDSLDLSDSNILIAIINDQKGDTLQRDVYLKKAKSIHPDNHYISLNEEAFKKPKLDYYEHESTIYQSKCAFPEDFIGHLEIDSILSRVNWQVEDTSLFRPKGDLRKYIRKYRFSEEVDHLNYQYLEIDQYDRLFTKNTYQKITRPERETKCEIIKGDNIQKVIAAYGDPYSQITSNKGILMFYILSTKHLNDFMGKPKCRGIIFSFNKNQLLDHWIITQQIGTYLD